MQGMLSLCRYAEPAGKEEPSAARTPKTSQKVHLLTFKCYRFRIGHFWQDYFRQKFLNGSLEPVLAGFGIKVALG